MRRWRNLVLGLALIFAPLGCGSADSARPIRTSPPNNPPQVVTPSNTTPGDPPKGITPSRGDDPPVGPQATAPPVLTPAQQQSLLEEIKQLGGLVKLADGRVSGISLADSLATDDVLQRVGGMPDLGFLMLGNSQISGEGLYHLRALTTLEKLSLANTAVDDAGLAHLRSLPQLLHLDLYHTEVTDAGLAHLAVLTELEELRLQDTRITDEGLKHLAGMKKLKMLRLRGTLVTQEGVDALKKSLSEGARVYTSF